MDDLVELAKMQKEQLKIQLQQAQVGVQTAQAGLKIQQDQGKMLDKQVAQSNQPQADDGGQGPGGEAPPPDDNGPGSGGGASDQNNTAPSDASQATPSAAGDNGASPDQSDQGGDYADASAEVDKLIAQAKAKAQQNKGQRVQVPDTDRAAISRKWALYYDLAVRAVKQGRVMSPFKSGILPAHHLAYAADALQRATTLDAVRAVFADIRDAETHPIACRCLVCGCGEPYNSHGENLPTLDSDVVATVAPHTEMPQSQLTLSECPKCGKDADNLTTTGYWYTGMVCPQCGHEFTVADDQSPDALSEMRALRADVLRMLGTEVALPPFPEMTRYHNQQEIHGAGGRIIGNIGLGGGKVEVPGVPTTHHHEPGTAAGGIHGDAHAQTIAYWQDRRYVLALRRQLDPLDVAIDNASQDLRSMENDQGEPWFNQHAYDTAGARLQDLETALSQARGEIAAATARMKASPVDSRIASLPPTVTHENMDAAHTMATIFGRALADHEIAGLVGAQQGDLVAVHYIHSMKMELHLYEHNDNYEARRTVTVTPQGVIHIHNDEFVVEDSGRGIGVKIFAAQVRGATAAGVARIDTTGGKGPITLMEREVDMNGYYTWPRLGYNGDLIGSFADRASREVGHTVSTVRDLMMTADGRDFWKDEGYQIGLQFDLAPGSDSRKILAAYMGAKGMDNTGIERAQQPDAPQKHWVDLDWTAEDEAAADVALAKWQQDQSEATAK